MRERPEFAVAGGVCSKMAPLRPTPLLFALIALALAACASPEEQRQQDIAACQGYGFAPGTPDFAACLQRQQIARQGSGPSFGIGVGAGSFGGGGFGGGGIGLGL
jgi:hypothetical protein